MATNEASSDAAALTADRAVIRDSEIEPTGLNRRASTIGESTVGLLVSGVDSKLQTRVIVGLVHQDFPKPCVSAVTLSI